MIIKPIGSHKVGDLITHRNGQRMVIVAVLLNGYGVSWFDPFDTLHQYVLPFTEFE